MEEFEGVSIKVLFDESFTLDYGQYHSVIDEDVFSHLWSRSQETHHYSIAESEGHDERELSLNNVRIIETPVMNWIVYPFDPSKRARLQFPVLKAVTVPATVKKSGFSISTFFKFLVVGTNRKGLPVTRKPIRIVGCDNSEVITDCLDQIDEKVEAIRLRGEIRMEGA